MSGTAVSIAKNSSGDASVTCPGNLKVIAGGYSTTVPNGSNAAAADLKVYNSLPVGTNGWTVSGSNTPGTGSGSGALALRAYAICAQ